MIEPAFTDVEHGPISTGDMAENQGGLHRRHNYDLCRAVDITKLGVVLDEMVSKRGLSPELASVYLAQADSLLAALRSENNRLIPVRER